MTKTIRERRREELLAMITGDGRTRVEGVALAGKLLYVSEHTISAWLKPESSKSSNEIPLMAIELLYLKLRTRRKVKR